MKRTVPGFTLIDFGVPAPPTDGEPHANHQVADRVAALLAAHLGRPLDDALRRAVLVGVEATDSLLHLAFRTDPAGDEALVKETRTLLHAYFAHTFDRPPGGQDG